MLHNFNKEIENTLTRNETDKDIEIFWYSFKQNIINFIKTYNIELPIEYWSNTLNFYQSKKDYINIRKNINMFISLFCIEIFKYTDSYHTSILWFNIKQWKKINRTYFNKDQSYYMNVYDLLLDIFRYMLLNGVNELELFNFYKNIDSKFNDDNLCILNLLSHKLQLNDVINKLKKYKKF